MGRQYASILGSIAFTTVVIQGLVRGAEVESTLQAAAISTILFSGIGYVVGRLAGWIVLDSLRGQWADASARRPLTPRQLQSTRN